MHFDSDGFLSPTWLAYAREVLVASECSQLARKTSRVVQRLLMRAAIPDVERYRDPRVIARLLLARALTNFQGAVMLCETGLDAESRTLGRSCLETAFCLDAVLRGGDEFVDRLFADDRMHKRGVAKNMLALAGENAIDEELAAVFRQFVEGLGDDPPHWLKPTDMANSSELKDLFPFYRHLSEDAHPTLGCLERFMREEDGEPMMEWGPERDAERIADTILLTTTFVIAAASSYNQHVERDNRVGSELQTCFTELSAMRAHASSSSAG